MTGIFEFFETGAFCNLLLERSFFASSRKGLKLIIGLFGLTFCLCCKSFISFEKTSSADRLKRKFCAVVLISAAVY